MAGFTVLFTQNWSHNSGRAHGRAIKAIMDHGCDKSRKGEEDGDKRLFYVECDITANILNKRLLRFYRMIA